VQYTLFFINQCEYLMQVIPWGTLRLKKLWQPNVFVCYIPPTFLYIFYTYFWTCSPNEYAWNYCRWIFIKIHSINKKIVVFLTICNA
jgi:hypothetical protein